MSGLMSGPTTGGFLPVLYMAGMLVFNMFLTRRILQYNNRNFLEPREMGQILFLGFLWPICTVLLLPVAAMIYTAQIWNRHEGFFFLVRNKKLNPVIVLLMIAAVNIIFVWLFLRR